MLMSTGDLLHWPMGLSVAMDRPSAKPTASSPDKFTSCNANLSRFFLPLIGRFILTSQLVNTRRTLTRNLLIIYIFLQYICMHIDSCSIKFSWSRIWQNFRSCCLRLGRDLLFIYGKHKSNVQKIDSCNDDKDILDSWMKSCCTEDVRVGHQIREVVEMRDSLEPWLLDYMQCKNVIEYLAVM